MIFVLGALILKEQTELFARAKMVIGLHGAGLSNFEFVRPGTLVGKLDGDERPFFNRWLSSKALGTRTTTPKHL